MSRNLTVDLILKSNRYRSGLRAATSATRDFDSGLKGVLDSARRLGSGALVAGVAGLVGAIGAVGTASLSAFVPFERSLSQIVGLVGIAADEVADMGEQVKGLASATGRGPQELADALFFITSAGLEGADAMAALEVSAKAAASGLGDTATIADTVTSAVNAYGTDVLSAAEATDVLVASVREGKAAAPSLASAFARVIPIAASLGVEFDEVGAAIAAMTRTGLSAEEAATALRQVLTSLLDPTTEARDTMKELGLSAEGLRASLGTRGVLPTLEQLDEAFEGNSDAMANVFGNVRALTGVLSLLGGNAENTRAIFGELATAAGSLDGAFAAAQDTAAFALEQAKAELQTLLIEAGEDAIPQVLAVLQDLRPELETLIPALGDLFTAIISGARDLTPVIVSVIGFISDLAGTTQIAILEVERLALRIAGAFDFLGNAPVVGPLFNFLGVATVKVGGLEDASENLIESQIRFARVLQTAKSAVRDGGDAIDSAATAMALLGEEGLNSAGNLRELQQSLGLTDEDMGRAAETALTFLDAQDALGFGFQQLRGASDEYRQALFDIKLEQQLAADTSDAAAMAAVHYAEAIGDTAPVDDFASSLSGLSAEQQTLEARTLATLEANESLSDFLRGLADPVFRAQQAMTKYQEVLKEIDKDGTRSAEEQLELAEAILETQGALDALDGQALEDALDAIALALNTSRNEAADLLRELGLLDGTEVTTIINVEERFRPDPNRGRAPTGPGFNPPRAVAGGGHFAAGEPLWVGESGPEKVTFDRPGRVTSAAESRAGTTTINNIKVEVINPIARDVGNGVRTGILQAGLTEAVEYSGSSNL